ncbi:MAG: DUF177 domain-containing protein [Paludibacteraceae bacterium]|nr:DUF177 domain-containing protein [Paludibacteraceae bacterium]
MSEKYFFELKSIEQFPHTESFKIGNEFFATDDKQEIEGGDLSVSVTAKRLGEGFSLDISLKGKVTVLCDRCLNPLDIEIEATDSVRVKDFDGMEYDDDDLLVMQVAETGVDLEWRIYEMASLALPMQKVHKDGECDKKMTDILNGYADTGKESKDSDDIDPRWDALKALKDRINN